MKKKLSRIAAMLLAVVMVITGIAVMPGVEADAADAPSFTVKTDVTEMKPGDTVHVEFWMDGGTNVMSVVGGFDFDTSVYTYVAGSLQLNTELYMYAGLNNGQYIVDQTDVYTAGGFSFLYYSTTVPINEDTMFFAFDVTVNEDAVGSGLMGFSCAGVETGTNDEDRQSLPEETNYVSTTYDANGNVIEEGKIPVVIELEDFAIDQDDFTMARGTSDKLTVTATPEADLAGKTVTWSSTDNSVVNVDQEGNIEATGVGTATITASCEEFSDSVTITVNAPLTGITLNTQETSIKKGDTADLDVIYTPEDTTDDKTVTWTSSDDEIATVDENGVVTALKDGETTITATVGSHTAECLVHVREVPLEGIDLDKTAITMNKGDKSEALVVSYNPEDTTDDKTVTWSSENEDIATVEDGVVTAVGAGTTNITAKVGEFTATCEVTVVVPLESISVKADGATDSLEVDDTVNLTVEYSPADTTVERDVTWTSSDDTVATVDENGTVTAVKGGTATITATVNGISATCDIKVLIHTTAITLGSSDLQLAKGQVSDPIAVTYNPENTDDSKDLTWTSSNADVATVDENGVVTAAGGGTATIRATLNANEDIYAECAVTVSVPLESITLTADKETDSLEVGDTVNLIVGYNPEDTTVAKDVVWTSSDDAVATVDNGTVTAVGGGTATITAAVNGISATCDVRVLKHTTGISLGTAEMNLMKGDVSDPIAVTFDPADTDDSKEVTWSSDNTAVAAVDSEGRVTGIGEGTAVITATAVDGGFTASCTVTVSEIHVQDAVLAEDTPSELYIGQNHTISVVITPENVTDEVTYSYASSDADVAAVDENGVVSALKAGTATITVTVTAGDFTKELSFNVEVKEIPLEGIAFKEEIKTLEEGQSAQLEILYNPENTTVDRTVTWNSSDPTVATVEDGLVKALKAGTTVITATVGDKEVSYELTVTEKQVTEPGTPSTDDPQNPGTGKPSTGGAQNSGDKVNNQNNGGAVQTGDTFNVFGIMLAMLVSLSAALVVVLKSRAKKILK